jgi:DNA-directed RNA polymerase subunit RPC12/RpoP
MTNKTYSQSDIDKFRNKYCPECGLQGIAPSNNQQESSWVCAYRCTFCGVKYELQQEEMGSRYYLESNA